MKLFLTEAAIDDYEIPVPKVVTPWDTFRKAVDNKAYNTIRQICSLSNEGVLSGYTFVEPEMEEEGIIPKDTSREWLARLQLGMRILKSVEATGGCYFDAEL